MKKLRIIIYLVRIFSFFIPSTSNKSKIKNIIIIKTDAIGDYVLFRNFLVPLKETKNCKITLIALPRLYDFIQSLDLNIIDEVIYLDCERLRRRTFALFGVLFVLHRHKYDLLINAVFTKDKNSMLLAEAIIAKEKIAFSGGDTYLPSAMIAAHDEIYSKLVKTSNIFEFYKNKDLFAEICGAEALRGIRPSFSGVDLEVIQATNLYLPIPYILVFIGAASPARRYSCDHFSQILEFVIKNYKFNIVLCGGEDDRASAKFIIDRVGSFSAANKLQNEIINLVGCTSFLQLLKAVKNAKFIISNETSIPHLAMALDVNTIVISNANHLLRFSPYPSEIIRAKYIFITHPKILGLDFFTISHNYQKQSDLNINEIPANAVIEGIKEIL